MGYSKRQFIEAAFEEIGLAAYVFDLQPQQMESALRRLDSMMAYWDSLGIRLSYPLPSDPEFSDINAETLVPDYANTAVIVNLGVQLAPSFGRNVMPDTKINARNAFNAVLNRTAAPMEKALPGTMPKGAGNKPWRITGNQYFNTPIDPLLAGGDGELEI